MAPNDSPTRRSLAAAGQRRGNPTGRSRQRGRVERSPDSWSIGITDGPRVGSASAQARTDGALNPDADFAGTPAVQLNAARLWKVNQPAYRSQGPHVRLRASRDSRHGSATLP